MKLITLSQFVLEKDKQIRKGESDTYDFTMSVTDYALFLQRPLELGMFVPCDEYGKVLFEVEGFKQNLGKEKQYFNVLKKVYKNIEAFIDYEDFKLTQTALEESRLITLI